MNLFLMGFVIVIGIVASLLFVYAFDLCDIIEIQKEKIEMIKSKNK